MKAERLISEAADAVDVGATHPLEKRKSKKRLKDNYGMAGLPSGARRESMGMMVFPEAEELIDSMVEKKEATIKMRKQTGVGKRSKTKKVPVIEASRMFIKDIMAAKSGFQGTITVAKKDSVVVTFPDRRKATQFTMYLDQADPPYSWDSIDDTNIQVYED